MNKLKGHEGSPVVSEDKTLSLLLSILEIHLKTHVRVRSSIPDNTLSIQAVGRILDGGHFKTRQQRTIIEGSRVGDHLSLK